MTDLEVISYSELDTYRQCRLKHQLSYRERWRTVGEEAEALARGSLFHAVMEAHYKRIQTWETIHGPRNAIFDAMAGKDVAEDLFLSVAPLLYEEGTGRQSERQELVEWIYRGYVDLYGIDNDWEIVAVEYPLEVPLSPGFVLKGTIDLLVRVRSMSSGLWVVDHKTCKNLPKQKDFDMEDQTGIYTHLGKQQGLDIRGAIYNHCRTWKLQRDMEMGERFKRTITVRTDQELETMAHEALETMEEAYARPLVLADGSPRDAPRTPDGERCGWKCGFTEACLAGRKRGPEVTRSFLEDTGFAQHDTKPGPTFNKDVG